MANRLMREPKTLENGVVTLYGRVTTSTSGTVGSQSCKGFTVAKTGSETGRYTISLADKYTSLLAAQVSIEGAADAAYTTAKGLTWILRGVDVAHATAPKLYIQFNDPDGSAADAELEDASVIRIALTLKNTSAY